jgi:hypothetical protein
VIIYALAVWGGQTSSVSAVPWFWPAVSAVLVISGVQLLTSWFLVRTLSILSKREACINQDLCGDDRGLRQTGSHPDHLSDF